MYSCGLHLAPSFGVNTSRQCLQVDERLNGDGVGLVFGVNEPILGWILAGMFGLVWTLYAASAKSFGQQEEDDGMSL